MKVFVYKKSCKPVHNHIDQQIKVYLEQGIYFLKTTRANHETEISRTEHLPRQIRFVMEDIGCLLSQNSIKNSCQMSCNEYLSSIAISNLFYLFVEKQALEQIFVTCNQSKKSRKDDINGQATRIQLKLFLDPKGDFKQPDDQLYIVKIKKLY